MRKLALYSDQIENTTGEMDRELVKLIGKHNSKAAFIPSCSDLSRKYYDAKLKYYNKIGINNLMYFDLDEEYDPEKIDELMSYDAIHLSGGNTFYFLSLFKKRNFTGYIRDYVDRGGVLIGISAGSIMMSKTIEIEDVIDSGDNNVSLNDKSSLGLVDFDFIPHWNTHSDSMDGIIEYSRAKCRTIYACNDGEGIIIDGEDIKLVGEVTKISNGQVIVS